MQKKSPPEVVGHRRRELGVLQAVGGLRRQIHVELSKEKIAALDINTPPDKVLDAVRDPGNAGAILRSAWAAGVDAILVGEALMSAPDASAKIKELLA